MVRIPRVLASGALAVFFALAVGCLRRDVAVLEPTTKVSFETSIPQPAIDKVDVLVMVDNSSSMADKQRILADAVPDLLRRLVQPNCVDKKTRAPTGTLADPQKADGEQCPQGSESAFPPITDIHIGVISSSLGGMGSSECGVEEKRHNDDHGHLIARDEHGNDVASAGELKFLAWYPDVEQNRNKARHPDPPVPPTKSLDALGASFRELVLGVGQTGCGFEAQLESVYHFLVQPDPWSEITKTDGRASYGSTDFALLRQRAAFLRPDSLVAVVMLTDEDDSSVDPLALDGSAWRFEDRSPMYRATAACASEPASPKCTSCGFGGGDANCSVNEGFYSAAEDPFNVRFHAMKRRFGVDPQFPIARYVDAFTKPKVPSREGEHAKGAYVGRPECTNPLFAARLPTAEGEELCQLPRGPRTNDRVYFAIIGGVPNSLLPNDGDALGIDWTRVLGKNPDTYDETGIDPHMIASTVPRPGLPPPTAADNADAVHGREWATGGNDLQFACTFDLYEVKDGKSVPAARACAGGSLLCDCHEGSVSPLCSATDKKLQVKGKAYPSRRELMVARELGPRAIVASLCPKQLSEPKRDDYGYRPAVRAIAERLEGSLVASCVPRPLERDPSDGSVPCLVLATLAEPGPDSTCERFGLRAPREEILGPFRDRVAAEEGEASRTYPVCEIPQKSVPNGESCLDDTRDVGFCYVEKFPGIRCGQSLLFTKATSVLAEARFTLQCIQISE